MAGRKRGFAGKILLLLIVAALAAGGVYLYRSRQKTGVDYKEEKAVTGDVRVTYSFTGEITAPNKESVRAESTGTVRDVYVSANQAVTKGQRLIRMEDGTIYKSDIVGEVISLPVHKGDYVDSDQVLATVSDLDRLEVEISIDEYDVDAVSLGMPVDVTVTALDQVCKGRIIALNKQADTSGQIAYFNATVELESIPGILPGMQVEAVLVKASAENVVTIHAQALQFTEQNEAYVLLADGHGGETIRRVDTGLTDGVMVEIRSGLAAGETVLYVDRDTSFEDLMRAFGQRGMNRSR